MKEIDAKTKKTLLRFQRNEITEKVIYNKLAKLEKDDNNRNVLERIAAEENVHYEILSKFTGEYQKPNMRRVRKYVWMSHLFGLTFAIKLMENGEKNAVKTYSSMGQYPEIASLSKDEEEHEQQLIGLIDEERLRYMGSVVLGLNDALVEFTGALAGYSLALPNNKMIALTGSITGIAAALSMSTSEFLSKKSEKGSEKPGKAAFYTGSAYLITVVALVAPFILSDSPIVGVVSMLIIALFIIGIFNYYYSVARSEKFSHRFVEMAILSFSVAALSFVIGFLLSKLTGIKS